MITIKLEKKEAPSRDGNELFTARYGDSDIVDVWARNEEEAEDKLMFMLIYKLRGAVLDFDPNDL